MMVGKIVKNKLKKEELRKKLKTNTEYRKKVKDLFRKKNKK